MRLTYLVPGAEDKIRQGALTLSVASIAMQRFNMAERNGVPLDAKTRAEIADKLDHCSVRDAERLLAETLGGPAPAKEKKTAYSGGTTRIEFTASARLMENIEKLHDLLAHKNFDGRLDQLFEYVAEIALDVIEKEKGSDPAAYEGPVTPATKTEKLTRYVPAKIRRAVWVRDGGCCQYRDPVSGRVCGSRRWVQMEHIVPISQGGKHEMGNLRLFCGAHNRFIYEREQRGANAPKEKSDVKSTTPPLYN